MPIRDIENHLERCDARIRRVELIEAVSRRDDIIERVIYANVAVVSILCAVYAIYSQF